MCHEFAHVLGLPDLFDQSTVLLGGEIDWALDSAGIGKWGLMGLGTLGWGFEDGPNPFSAWSLAQLGWLGRENGNLVEVTGSMRGLEMEQIDRGGPVYRIPVSEEEYFLIENRQNSGSFYNRNIPAGGLLVWHVDEGADNDEERHKQVDLVCADGLFADRGFPGEQPDPAGGRDNLDFWATDEAYASAHNGNRGDATDPFDGDRFDRADLTTNPGLRAHARFERGVPLGIAIENIRDLGGGRMGLDILVRQPVEGNVSADAAWSWEVVVGRRRRRRAGCAPGPGGGHPGALPPRRQPRRGLRPRPRGDDRLRRARGARRFRGPGGPRVGRGAPALRGLARPAADDERLRGG